MLLLSRKEGEGITLKLPNEQEVEILLNEYRGQQTIVGIKAPSDVVVLRNELLENDSIKSQQFH